MPLLNLCQLSDQKTRGYLYRLVTAAGALALVYGVVTATELAAWMGVVASLFAVPAYHTPTKTPEPTGNRTNTGRVKVRIVARDEAAETLRRISDASRDIY